MPVNDCELWVSECSERLREGKPLGCPKYYMGCQCNRCKAREEFDLREEVGENAHTRGKIQGTHSRE